MEKVGHGVTDTFDKMSDDQLRQWVIEEARALGVHHARVTGPHSGSKPLYGLLRHRSGKGRRRPPVQCNSLLGKW